MEQVKTLIIGSGPAGYTAAIYAGRADLKPVLYSGIQPGGQLTTTTIVENFPGYPNGVDGNQMMMDLKEQASRFGADIRDGSISKVDFSKRPYHIVDERGNEILADTVIIATGASAKYLGLADEEKYRGQGVSACATCDGFFYRKRTVAVVGGGDTACEEAMYLAGLAKKVYMIVRKPYLRAAEIMQQRVKEKENIEILFETNTLGLFGENGVEGAHLVKRKGESDEEEFDIAIDGFFLAIGHKPNTELFKDYIDLDEQGFIKVVPGTTSTNVPGVLQQVMWQTQFIVRELLQQVLAQRQPLRQTDIYNSFNRKIVMIIDKNTNFEEIFKRDLHQYLCSINRVDEHLPEAPDLEELWAKIGENYLPDAMKEFTKYPTVSLGWIMFVGMAMAKYWDVDWELYSKVENHYEYLKNSIDFDHMDDYICEKILLLDEESHQNMNRVVAECASRTLNQLAHMGIEPGTETAFRAFIAALHQMYLMGIAIELKALGYHMTQLS